MKFSKRYKPEILFSCDIDGFKNNVSLSYQPGHVSFPRNQYEPAWNSGGKLCWNLTVKIEVTKSIEAEICYLLQACLLHNQNRIADSVVNFWFSWQFALFFMFFWSLVRLFSDDWRPTVARQSVGPIPLFWERHGDISIIYYVTYYMWHIICKNSNHLEFNLTLNVTISDFLFFNLKGFLW